MKELKISISDELYEELSTVPDKDSFLIELLENKLKISGEDNAGSVEDAEEPCFEEPQDIAGITDDVPDGGNDIDDQATEVTGAEDAGEEIPEEAYFELEDVFEEEDIIADDEENELTLCCNCSLVGPDDLEDCKGPVLDVDFADPGEESSKSVSELIPSTEKENNSSIEKMACFESIIVDLIDRICELEGQIIDMSTNVQFLKERSILSDIGGNKAESDPVFPARSGSIVAEIHEEAVPYATLSFPELKIPPELLSDVEVPVAEIEHDDVMETPMESRSPNVPEAAVKEASFSEPFKPVLFDTDTSSLTSSQTPTAIPVQQIPSLQDSEIATDNMKNDGLEQHPSQAAKPDAPVPAVNAPVADKLESCIFAYLSSGSEVKKDVIKSLLSKRYLDNEVESKIDQLLSAGKISNIVKDDRVYLMRLPEKESA
ncbi:hypothetical protein SAMN04488587_1069 [Methanococcoides vulcani]|uniref:Uncharacterized protein n=1 Tax=Methanococcoides vulcani TaxID=1353158 RepID=A0A1H9ZES5_9EURY|nr:hypothetical protein [Methanococcoides vulcani]SES80086.1 hypothetical protein SAMN04488587_1069 [Methanococcoides vulcani]